MAASIASLPRDELEALIDGLSPNAQAALPYLFEVWGHGGHQLPPRQDWSTWLILGGRGAGKTRAGAEWLRSQVEGATPLSPGRRRKICLIAETIDQAVEVMIRGESGILACTPSDRTPHYHASRKMLIWPNGAEAQVFSASNPESLRGPQFDCAWADELGKWKRAKAAWDMLQMGLRLGERPQTVVTTTPRANAVLEALLETESCAVTSAPTKANSANLANSFLKEVYETYGGSAQGRQELDGEFVLDRPGALWTRRMIDAVRVKTAPEMQRIVVAVDPPSVSGASADECGIIVMGQGHDGAAYVLADRSSQGETPARWAARAVAAYDEFQADRIIAEVNQGGELVEGMIRQVAPEASYASVRATRGKKMRAEPVSALYERGMIRHLGVFPTLEDQMCDFGAEGDASGSPDRVDALVWAATDLMLARRSTARVRILR